MAEVRIPALAKINLRLEVIGKRADGYHELRTIFQTISLQDEIRLKSARQPGITLKVLGNDPLSNEPLERNLVYRAVASLRQVLKLADGVAIELHKVIPAGRGLGGGSSDAAAALIGYLRLAKKQLPRERLFELAATLGADVPFFLEGGRALGIGKGDEIYPLPDVPKLSLLVVSPNSIQVPTPDAYRWLNSAQLDSLQANAPQLTNSPCWRVAVRRCLEFSRAQLRRAEPLLGFRTIRLSFARQSLAIRIVV